MGRIAVSISHEGDYAVAIAFGIRTAGGAFCFRRTSRSGSTSASARSWSGCVGCATWRHRGKLSDSVEAIDRASASRAVAAARSGRPQGHVRHGHLRLRLARLRRRGAAVGHSRGAGRRRSRRPGRARLASDPLFAGRVPELITVGLPETDRRRRYRRHGGRPRPEAALARRSRVRLRHPRVGRLCRAPARPAQASRAADRRRRGRAQPPRRPTRLVVGSPAIGRAHASPGRVRTPYRKPGRNGRRRACRAGARGSRERSAPSSCSRARAPLLPAPGSCAASHVANGAPRDCGQW